ncbi:SgcJ/EcaC family oxidoreductase [Phytomonospora endophytica]|uniref:Uncharacterized protein (TIGR02246 family) n=1 Tax=Phytomonospora endophytica TaxID=714109 RepID=A0A841FUF7_9ACTN|nr:SgcJ/EcaC family oxidoreductase [Phytomonospora endophytica]MBB6037182.1 uncharacterized protein (TIGR02246 family) [Phytomonospora endophytica]GIG71222.1 hypothetical protein Pen01_75170 [Phytomonospora endophytica]
MSEQRIHRIRETIAAYERHQSDPDAFLPLHRDDVAIVNFVGRRVLGLDTLGQAMRGALASPLAKVTTTLDIEGIHFIRPDVAIVSLAKHVNDDRDETDKAPRDGAAPTVGSLTLVLTEDDGEWRIALAQTTPRTTF